MDHYIWGCCFFKATRCEQDKELEEIDAQHLLPAIRRGHAPALKCIPGATYWGLNPQAGDGTMSAKTAKAIFV